MSRARCGAIGLFLGVGVLSHLLALSAVPVCEGTVETAAGPAPIAVVGWQGKIQRVRTDALGRFRIHCSEGRLVASMPGFRIASQPAGPAPFRLRLVPLPAIDHDEYEWIDPHADPARPNNCANCHKKIYLEWSRSAHARSATNRKFLALFAGTDGVSPERPTWNARREHPDGSAVCASCHVPTLTSPTLEYDVREARGVHKSGIHCDYCHKVAEVPEGKFGTRFGRDALELLRPAPGDLLTFGPLDDAVRAGESFAHRPIYRDSRYCAACHEGTVFGVHAYGTYSEWLKSPARAQGKECQTCHMAPTGDLTNMAPGHGGIERAPRTLASHGMPGGQFAMLRSALRVRAEIASGPNGHTVTATLQATDVGHRVPTGFPDRHLVLLVQASDANGREVAPLDGTRLPPAAGKWSGQAGYLFAKQLHGEAERTPIPFWVHVERVVDTRLTPGTAERHRFRFPPMARRVTVQVWYRRFWPEVADANGWRDNEQRIVEQTLEVADTP